MHEHECIDANMHIRTFKDVWDVEGRKEVALLL